MSLLSMLRTVLPLGSGFLTLQVCDYRNVASKS
jgi:hypothetical protein